MQRSEHRILTTHAGRLPRPPALVELLARQHRREPVDPAAFATAVTGATEAAVAWQIAAGIDIGNYGEQARESFFTYVQHRLSGFGGESAAPRLFKDMLHFPTFRDQQLQARRAAQRVSLARPPMAIGPVAYADRAPLDAEIAAFRAALAEADGGFVESFMTAPSPGIVAAGMANAHYASLEAYIDALAEALRTEYEALVAAGFTLQIDAPDLAMERHTLFGERPLPDFLAFVALVTGAINRALAHVPRDRVRLHVCWGNYDAPHIFDVPLDEILSLLYEAKVGALLVSLANPRHAHEVRCFARTPLPAELLLIAGVIDTTTNYVEHPEVVADRIEAAAVAVGDPRRVLAGTDCGFDTAAGFNLVAEEVCWEQLRSLCAGAEIASARLY